MLPRSGSCVSFAPGLPRRSSITSFFSPWTVAGGDRHTLVDRDVLACERDAPGCRALISVLWPCMFDEAGLKRDIHVGNDDVARHVDRRVERVRVTRLGVCEEVRVNVVRRVAPRSSHPPRRGWEIRTQSSGTFPTAKLTHQKSDCVTLDEPPRITTVSEAPPVYTVNWCAICVALDAAVRPATFRSYSFSPPVPPFKVASPPSSWSV